MFDKINGDKPSTATHATQVVALNTAHKLVMVNNHCRKRWRGPKQAGIHHNNPNLLSSHPSLLQHLINAREDHHPSLPPRLFQTRLRRNTHDRFWEICLLSQPGSLQNLLLKTQILLANSYHNELLEVFPNLYSVILEGSMCHSLSSKFFSMASSTAFPPAWMQKCSNANLKSGMASLAIAIRSLERAMPTRPSASSFSDTQE
nr:hypothetical protein Ccrd_025451 [Ipomoea batatas]